MGIAIAVVFVAAVGIVSIKAMLGDESTELPYEEQVEKTLSLEEGQSSEPYESAEDEAREYQP